MSMKLPELLSGHTMTVAGVIRPISMSQTWKEEGQSTATITMPPEAEDIDVGAWIRVHSPNGSMSAVMYVKTKKTDYVTGIKTYTLEHCFQLLQESILFGEHGPSDMGGSEDEVLAETAIRYLLAHQETELFAFGGCAFEISEGWSFKNSNVHADLMDITEAIEDCTWSFDMTSLPWSLSLVAYPTTASMEMRRSRNISSMSISIDKSQMYTRAFPVGSSDLHIDGGYIERNTEIYGIIGKVITESSIESEAHLRAWATKQLKKNSVPYVSISISGVDLSEATGESLDRIVVGRICRVPLPDYNDTVTERITEVSWRNCMLDEMTCTVVMANERKTVQGVMNSNSSSGGAGSNKSLQSSGCKLHDHDDEIKDHWTAIQRNDYYIRLEAYERVNGDNYNYSYIEQTASYIRSEVGETANGLYSRIEQTASYIRAEVANTANGLYSRIEQTASYIRSEVADTAASIRSEVTQTASSWEAKISGVVDGDGNVTAASISVAINENGSQAVIAADHIDLQGIVNSLNAYDVTVSGLTVEGQSSFSETVYCDADIQADVGTFGSIQANDANDDPQGLNVYDADVSGNTLTIYRLSGGNITFSKATTLSPSWSGSTLTISAQQTNGGSTSTVATHLVELGGNYTSGRTTLEFVNDGQAPSVVTMLGAKTLTVPLKVRSLNSGSTAPTDRLNTSISCNPATVLESKTGTSKITANGTYYPGTNCIGFSAVEVDVQGGTVNTGLVIDTTNHEIRTSTSSTTQTVAIESTISLNYSSATHKYIANGSALANGNTIHEATGIVSGNQAYNAGWGDAYADVSLPTTNTSDNFTVTTPSSTVGGTAVITTYTISNSTDNMVQVKSGSGTVVGRFTHGKYNEGFNAVGSPTITWPSTITTGTREDSISIKASVDAKTTGTARSTTMQLSIGQSTFTTSGGITGYPCVNLYSAPNQGGNIIGRSDCGAIHNNGGKTAWLYQQSGSSWSKVTKNTTLGYGKTLRVRYTAANKNVANVTDAVFYTPTLNLQAKDVTVSSTTTIYPDSGYDGLSSVVVRPAHQSYFTLTRGTKIQDNVYQYTVTLGSNVTGNAQSFTVYY